jgi:hypothetical protein
MQNHFSPQPLGFLRGSSPFAFFVIPAVYAGLAFGKGRQKNASKTPQKPYLHQNPFELSEIIGGVRDIQDAAGRLLKRCTV